MRHIFFTATRTIFQTKSTINLSRENMAKTVYGRQVQRQN